MSVVRKRSIAIRGHRTSFSLEQPFFDELSAIAAARGMALAALVVEIDAARPRGANLSSALRIFVLDYIKRGARQPTADIAPRSIAAGSEDLPSKTA